MAEMETKSPVSETKELTPEEKDGLAKAINNWIVENPKEFAHIKSVRKGLVENEEIRCDSIDLILKKSSNAQIFFNLKYTNDKIEIDHNLRDNRLGSTLEGVLNDLRKIKSNEKLDDAINNYCNNINIEELKDDKDQILNFLITAKNKRNITGPHLDNGLPATDDKCREAWRDHIVGLLIIGFVEYHKNKQKRKRSEIKKSEDIIKKCLSDWYNAPSHQSFNGVHPRFKEDFIDNKKDELIKEIIPIFKEKIIQEPLLNIISSLDEKQELVTVDDFPNMEKFAKELLFYANCSIKSDVYDGCTVENSSLDTGLELLEKLCLHLVESRKSAKSAITETKSGFKNIAQINENSEDFDVYFFRTLFLIGALKLCFKEAKSGVVFFTKDVNVIVKPFKNAKETDLINLTKNEPHYRMNHQGLFDRNNKKTNEATANCGKESINKSITIKKTQWCIVLIYFPDKGENMMEVVKETSFPGLENIDELWQDFIKKVPEIRSGNGDDDSGKTGDNEEDTSGTTPIVDTLQQNKQAFNDYKEKNKNDLFVGFGDLIDKVNEFVKVIDNLSYDEDKSLEGNKTVIDTEIRKIRIELDKLRKQSQISNDLKEFEKCKEEYIKEIQKLNCCDERCQELKENAQKDIIAQPFDDTKDLLINKSVLNKIYETLNTILQERIIFEDEKQSSLNELKRLEGKSQKGILLKKDATSKIEELAFDESKNLDANKAALKTIIEQLKSDLAKIGFLDIAKDKINISVQWVDKNWKWCALVLCTIVLGTVLMIVYNGDERVRIPTGEAVPSLESNEWRISEMDGKSVLESAEVRSADGSNTHYSLRHITETGKEIIVTFNIDWQMGTATSPELGEGKIEKDSKLNTIKITFEKWTIKKYY